MDSRRGLPRHGCVCVRPRKGTPGLIVFTDLDGTLLDRETYSFAPALPAILALRRRGIPLVLVSSKTQAEMEALREEMGNGDPYIVENGGAIVFPDGRTEAFAYSNGEARRVLAEASAGTGIPVRGFSEMTLQEIVSRSGLPAHAAALAAQRHYGEPFALLSASDPGPLLAAIRASGFSVVQGGRFFHISKGCDKSLAVCKLASILGDEQTAGLGDAPNDIEFLRAVGTPILVPSPHLETMRAALPHAAVAPAPGPQGWNAAVLELIGETAQAAPL